MIESNTLYLIIKEFNSEKGYLGPDKISAVDCGYIFEDLVRRFSESFGEEAGAHFTSRDIIYLMTDLLLTDANLDTGGMTVYDMTMGTSQMLSCMEERIHDLNSDINGGAGNPPNPNGYPTAYLWENVFQKDSMMDIIQKFIHLQIKKDKKLLTDGTEKSVKKTILIFPRYHQLDVVRKLVADGKSNSIAWTAYRLASLFDENNKPVFSSVIVVTDRTVLDAQLQETISGFDHKLGTIETIGEDKNSQDLKNAINDRARIIVTTLQKFPVIYTEVDRANGRCFAVIVDEAHSSQTGSSALKLKTALADTEEALREYAEREGLAEKEVDPEDRLVKEMIAHGKHKNLSFFAFTATPKAATLEMFGQEHGDGSFHPFHVYSMRQAIEEKFILDVLQNYMTYNTCFRIAKTMADNPDVPSSRAAKIIRRYQELHPYNISQKSQILRMFDKELQKEYVFCAYLIGLLPKDPVELVDLEGKLKLEYYKLQKTFQGVNAIMSAMAEVIYRELRKKETKISEESGVYTYEVLQNLSMVAERTALYRDGDQ